jgi:hypothetical protein
MAIYRETRNIEYSIVTYLESKLRADGWNGITVVKGFSNAYSIKTMPIISIEIPEDTHNPLEIGSLNVRTYYKVIMNIFADEDGIKLDLKDWLISVITQGCPYYEVATDGSGNISIRSDVSRIGLIGITANRNVNLGDGAAKHDRHRRQIEMTIYITGRA